MSTPAVWPIPITAPFFHIAVHVEKAPGIWHSPPNRKWHRLGVFTSACRVWEPAYPSILVKLPGQFIAGMVRGGGAGTAGILPFGFGRQTIKFVFLFREPFAEFDRVVPAHKNNSFIVLFGEAQFPTKPFVLRVELLILSIGNFSHGHPKRPGDCNPVHRFFVPITAFFLPY